MPGDSIPFDRELSAAQAVRHQLEREISAGTLLPGDTLDEDGLAARSGVSRTPVREALLHLSVRRMVSIVPRTGIYISRLSIPELMALLKGACANLATRRLCMDAAALPRVHEQSQTFVDAPEVQAYSRANVEFHEILYRACRNNALLDEIAHIRRRIQVHRQSAFQRASRISRSSREEHGCILEAMFAGDAIAASQLMIAHISMDGQGLARLHLDGAATAACLQHGGPPWKDGRKAVAAQRGLDTRFGTNHRPRGPAELIRRATRPT